MSYEMKNLQGSLFKNTKKEKDTHADYQGSCLINGVEYWVNGWKKEGKNGAWMSLAFKAKDRQTSGVDL